MITRSLTPLVLLLITLPGVARADADYLTASSLGMAGAVRTLGGDPDVVRLNPAAMPVSPGYLSAASYSFFGRDKSHRFNTEAYDSKTGSFALGSSYSVQIWEPPFDPRNDLNWFKAEDDSLQDQRTFHRWDFAGAFGFMKRKLNIGMSARLIRYNYKIRENATRFTIDAGLNLWLLPFLGVSVSANNLIPAKKIPNAMRLHPLRLNVGAALKFDPVIKVGVDVIFDFTSAETALIDLHAGAEVNIFQTVKIRAGFYSDRKFKDTFVTWGAGVGTEKVQVNFGMRIELGEMDLPLRADRPEANNRFYNSIGVTMNL